MLIIFRNIQKLILKTVFAKLLPFLKYQNFAVAENHYIKHYIFISLILLILLRGDLFLGCDSILRYFLNFLSLMRIAEL